MVFGRRKTLWSLKPHWKPSRSFEWELWMTKRVGLSLLGGNKDQGTRYDLWLQPMAFFMERNLGASLDCAVPSFLSSTNSESREETGDSERYGRARKISLIHWVNHHRQFDHKYWSERSHIDTGNNNNKTGKWLVFWLHAQLPQLIVLPYLNNFKSLDPRPPRRAVSLGCLLFEVFTNWPCHDPPNSAFFWQH